jgi:hypothetical protein
MILQKTLLATQRRLMPLQFLQFDKSFWVHYVKKKVWAPLII